MFVLQNFFTNEKTGNIVKIVEYPSNKYPLKILNVPPPIKQSKINIVEPAENQHGRVVKKNQYGKRKRNNKKRVLDVCVFNRWKKMLVNMIE